MLFNFKKPVELQIIDLNQRQSDTKKHLDGIKGGQDGLSQFFNKICQMIDKETKTSKKTKKTQAKDVKSTVYVLDFDGDIKASAVDNLREEISTIISIAKAGDEVVIRLDSGGGQVNAYGLAAAQLVRIKQAGLTLTICVDKIAASGGYMMACTANQIIASDFAVLGSVGVISQLPNFHELLQKYNIGFEQFTAGEYKRTVTLFGENTEEDRAKHQADIERIHELFKDFVAKHRPNLQIEKIATGEIWFGKDAYHLGLIDEISTSDAYILEKLSMQQVYLLQSRSKPTLAAKLGLAEQLSTGAIDLLKQTAGVVGESLAKFSRPSL